MGESWPDSEQLNKNETEEQNVLKRKKELDEGFPGGRVVKNPPANAGDTGSIPGLGRSHMPRNN